MPFPNEHSARVADPGSFDDASFRRKKVAPGISLILAKRKGGSGSMEAQAYRFDRKHYTAEQAHAWLGEHKIHPILWEPAAGDDLQKATLPPGSIRQWQTGDFQKQPNGDWKPVDQGKIKEQYQHDYRAKRDSEKRRLQFLAASEPGQRDIDGEEIAAEHVAAARRRLGEIEAEEGREKRQDAAKQTTINRREAAKQVGLFDEAPRAPKGQQALFSDRQIDEARLDRPRQGGASGQAMLFSREPAILVPGRR